MTTLTSRKLVRQRLKTLLEEITTFVAVYDHETKDFERKSPIAMVHSDGSMTTFPDFAREFHRFWVTLFWTRGDDDLTEDYFDDLAKDVRQKLYDNVEEVGYWHDIHFDEEFSEMDYVIIDGVMYRRERIRIEIYVVESGGVAVWLPLSSNLTYDLLASSAYLFQNNNGTNPVTAFGQIVLSWRDRITAALMVATTGATYDSENGFAALQFPGVNEQYVNVAFDNPAGARTYQLVMSSLVGSGISVIFSHGGGAQTTGSFYFSLVTGALQFSLGTTLHRQWVANAKVIDGAPHIVTVTLPSADAAGILTATLYIDGELIAVNSTTTSGGASAWTTWEIGGGGNDFEGHLYRVLVYNRVLTDGERDLNEAGLADIYDIVLL